MSRNEASREILWNISASWLMYLLFAVALAIAACGFYRRIRIWRRGRPAMRWDRPAERFLLFLRQGIGQTRTLREVYPGVFHTFIFAGFVILTAATAVVMLDYDLHTGIMTGRFYLFFQSLAVDLFGGLLLLGVLMAAARRWFLNPRHLVLGGESNWILALIFLIALSGFLVEGLRIAATRDPWGLWSPIGYGFAALSARAGNPGALRHAHRLFWWIHLLLAFGLLAWLPYTKLIHLFTGPLSIYTANLDGHGRVFKPVDFASETEPLGINDLARFSWKDLLDLDACTECGRCSAVCPAHSAGKSLSPRDLILDLRRLMHSRSAVLAGPRGKDQNPNGAAVPILNSMPALTPKSLWECTTCAACMQACPVYIEHLSKIIDMRRHLAMEEVDLPAGLAAALTSLERRGHPFPGTRFSRLDWADGLGVPVLSEMDKPEDVEVLLWVGCANALLERNHSVIRSLAQLLKRAGVSFAVLGREERCTGDPARRAGNEFLFEKMARRNIEVLQRYGISRIVTACPHCRNAFQNDYPPLGGVFETIDHVSFLAGLVAEGRLEPDGSSDAGVTYHDPCYLARYHGVLDQPRRLLRLVAGSGVREMSRGRLDGFCCGGGGGLAFMEEPPSQRVNRERAQQALETGAQILAVACPFCLTMLEDGIVSERKSRMMEVRDVAELLWKSFEKEA